MPTTPSSSMWEHIGIVTSVTQMIFYMIGFLNYKERLGDLADDLQDHAQERFGAYRSLRDEDHQFYDYYCNLPDYDICETDVMRSKGAAWAGFGSSFREKSSAVRGFAQAQNAHLVDALGVAPIHESAIHRAQTLSNERSRVDTHVIERWSAIVNAPTNPSMNTSQSAQINSSFSSLTQMGNGFNSAGTAFGSQLFGLMNG